MEKGNIRIDYFPHDNLNGDNSMLKFKMRDDGYLEGQAILTNVGVFPYLLADGTIQRELRPPEEVFDAESIKTLRMVPLTNDHPDVAVTTDNIKKYQVGHIGDNILQDQYHLAGRLLITDQEAVNDINSGKRALSMGYKVDLKDESGVWMGMQYDKVQTNIRYNHGAIVDRGRAGDAAVIKMDTIDSFTGVLHIDSFKLNKKGEKEMPENLKSIRIDGVEYNAEGPVIQKLTRLQEENENLKKDQVDELEKIKKDSTTLLAERDQYKEDNEKLKKELEDKTSFNADDFEKAVQERLVLLDAAKRTDVEIKADMAPIDIKKEIIVKYFPSTKEKLDSEDEVYVNVRFDMVMESLEKDDEDKEKTDNYLAGDSLKNHGKGKEKLDSKSAYEKMVERDYKQAYLRNEEAV
jgi:hypothetical protein